MPKLLLIALPVLFLLTYLMGAALIGRPLSRHAANISSAVLLLLYFLGTAALGIFWVARQELPVFDLHYLFGYMTLLMVFLHLTFNLRIVTAFVRRRLARRGERRRPTRQRAWAGRLSGLLAVGVVSFWLGLRVGSDRIVIEWPQEPPAQAGRGVNEEEVRVAPPSENPFWKLVLYYHERASFSETRSLARSANPYWGVPHRPFKEYRGSPVVTLPGHPVAPKVAVSLVFAGKAPPFRDETSRAIDLQDLALLLHHTCGVTAVQGGYELRAAPSSGALFPVEIYVAAQRIEGLEEGLYHYHPGEERLERIEENRSGAGAGVAERIALAAGGDREIREAAATLLLSAVVSRTATKYGDRSYRYALLDAGHAAANLLLSARALGLRARAAGRFADGELHELFALDGTHEVALLLVPLGSTAGSRRGGEGTVLRTLRAADAPRETGVVGLVHAATSLRLLATERKDERAPGAERGAGRRSFAEEKFEPEEIVSLPEPSPVEGDLFETIQKRRSRRRYANRPLPLETLSAILGDAARSAGVLAGSPPSSDSPSPSIEKTFAVRCYAVVNALSGVPPGLYRYLPGQHSLARVRSGSLRREAYVAAVRQEVAKRAAVLLIFTARVDSLLERSGARGYRYALLDCGLLAERIYLAATARGTGVCSVGAFFDPEMQKLLEIEAGEEIALHTVALGPLSR